MTPKESEVSTPQNSCKEACPWITMALKLPLQFCLLMKKSLKSLLPRLVSLLLSCTVQPNTYSSIPLSSRSYCAPPPPPPLGGTYSQIFKKQEGLTGPQLLGGGCWERGSDVSGGVQR